MTQKAHDLASVKVKRNISDGADHTNSDAHVPQLDEGCFICHIHAPLCAGLATVNDVNVNCEDQYQANND